MIKVLIVDDERNIREGIQKLIDWQALGCEVVGTAVNGISALSFIKENPVDIVVTDIKMPVMDGLELSKRIRDDYKDIKVIILTAYSEFEMAKTAIKFNVSDFIVKNDFMDELPKSIEKNVKLLNERKMAAKKTVEQEIESDEQYIYNALMTLVTNREIDGDLVKRFDNKSLVICACEISQYEDGKTNERNLNDMFKNILKIGLKNCKFATMSVNPELLVIGLTYEKSEGMNLNRVVEYFSNILIMVEEFMRIVIKIGISTETLEIASLKDAYGEAKDALSKIDKTGCGLKVYDANLKEANGEFVDVDWYSEKICDLTFDEKEDYSTGMLKEFTDKLKDSGCSFEQCKLYMLVIYSTLIHRAVRYQLNVEIDFNEYENELYKRVQRANTITALQVIGEETIEKIRTLCIGKKNFKNELVKKVDDCIKANYMNELTLQTISNEIFLNSSYVSRAYKKMTGVTVTEAITQFRISKAKDLLKNSNMKVYEIAEVVGFKDAAYFTNVFVKSTDISPSDYRAAH